MVEVVLAVGSLWPAYFTHAPNNKSKCAISIMRPLPLSPQNVSPTLKKIYQAMGEVPARVHTYDFARESPDYQDFPR